MFCYQCQETALGKGCTVKGVCGKSADVAILQDLLIYLLKGISRRANKLRKEHQPVPREVNRFVSESLFMTITNANFDRQRFEEQIREAIRVRDSMPADPTCTCGCQTWTGSTFASMESKAVEIGVLSTEDENVRSLRQLITYGLKGMAAYAEHAAVLGYEDEEIYAFMQEALVATNQSLNTNELISLTLSCGENGLRMMSLLDRANTSSYGYPEKSVVELGVRNNPGILVTGHDLRDLEELLRQTEGTGVDVYTHGEMLPAHYYPAFKKYGHFAGNYGSSWWHQKEEFETFNGPILFTTNCLVPPLSQASYIDRAYTTGPVGYPGFVHIEKRKHNGAKDFSVIIEQAKKCAPPTEIEKGTLVGGFAHKQVLDLSDAIIDAVKTGKISKFVVMAGCDGRMKSRAYYTEFAEKLPHDTIILTAGCAKYRYIKLPLGSIDGLPRVLDAGQCNDSYSLALIALALKKAFNYNDINQLPIVYNIAWYEQKAVIVLLALLSLGIKNIHLGPTLPAFLSPDVLKVLVDVFGVAGISEPDKDLDLFFPKSN